MALSFILILETIVAVLACVLFLHLMRSIVKKLVIAAPKGSVLSYWQGTREVCQPVHFCNSP